MSKGNLDIIIIRGSPFVVLQEPKNPDPWDGVLDTTDNKKICIQHPQWTISDVPLNFTEDCLYLNVFTPLVSYFINL